MNTKLLGLAAAALLTAAPAFAQTAGTTTGTTTAPGVTNGSTTTNRSSVIPPGAPGNRTGQQAASGESNQAVATTDANAAQPAHGANSFTEGQAKSRLESEGFSSVTNLRKDNDGVWRAQAQKGGSPVQAWLDYKGNIGTDHGGMGSSASSTTTSTSTTR